MKRRIWTTALAFAGLTVACERPPRLEVRTFELEHLDEGDAASLIDPYVYGDRPDARGTHSIADGAITVRETPDNLEQIARVLADHDRARPGVRLHFQLIEADGFTESDPRIADVVEQLRDVFRFGGYRLAGEAVVAATDASEVHQEMRGPEGSFIVTSDVSWLAPGTIRLQGVILWIRDPRADRPILQTTVNVRPGQTLVLGSAPNEGSSSTLLLTVRAEEVPNPA